MMRFPRFLQPLRRKRGARQSLNPTLQGAQPSSAEYDSTRARFERECG